VVQLWICTKQNCPVCAQILKLPPSIDKTISKHLHDSVENRELVPDNGCFPWSSPAQIGPGVAFQENIISRTVFPRAARFFFSPS
jgi:hypothetical protein